jgi:predicted aldo/keto reductase-like oxidoreductase
MSGLRPGASWPGDGRSWLCEAVIDIGQTLRLLDIARQNLIAELRAAYSALSAKASACTQCGACTERCPFGVDVIAKMQQAVELFE